jgi:hypothetical protein
MQEEYRLLSTFGTSSQLSNLDNSLYLLLQYYFMMFQNNFKNLDILSIFKKSLLWKKAQK